MTLRTFLVHRHETFKISGSQKCCNLSNTTTSLRATDPLSQIRIKKSGRTEVHPDFYRPCAYQHPASNLANVYLCSVVFRCVDVSWESRLCNLDQRGEDCWVVHCQFSQHAAVNFNLCGFEALDETVVGHAVCAGTSVNALDPQATEVTLALATVTVAVYQ